MMRIELSVNLRLTGSAPIKTWGNKIRPHNPDIYVILFSLLASSFEELLGRFQLALYRHYNSGGSPIYEPDDMEHFGDTHAPTLFAKITNAICSTRGLSKERLEMQRKRAVALLHILSYFR